jgi:hypothetical protein
MGDSDLLAGRKQVMTFLKLGDWEAVMSRKKIGMPIVKIAGRWEMSIEAYRKWRDTLVTENGQ